MAEELLGTKAYLVRAGVFKDVDVVLFAMSASNFGVSSGRPGTAWFRLNTSSRAKARMQPARRGGAEARWMPWN